jgi:hypothetical protein
MNTSFFHNFASARRKKNFIKRLKNEANQWVEGTEGLKPIVFDYFSNLFSSEVQATDLVLLEKIHPRVTVEMNEKLKAPYSAEGLLLVSETSKLQGQMGSMRYSINVFGMCLVKRLPLKFCKH